MSFSPSSLRTIRGGARKKAASSVALQSENSYLLTSRGTNYATSVQRFGGSGGILVAIGQVPESRRRLQWLRRHMINSAYQAIDGSTLTPSLCRFTVFCLKREYRTE
jgi:hypothetical protein